MRCVLGIDLGTGAAKAVVVDPDRAGAVLGAGEAAYPLHTPRPGWAEQDPEDWWCAVQRCVRQALAASGVPLRTVAGVGVTGQMQGSVFLDGADRAVREALLWCDQRSGPVAERAAGRIGQQRIVERTANPLLMGSTAGKALWLREQEPALYERVRRLLLPKDFVRLRLTGERATDPSDASATALFDVAGRTWSTEMIRDLELPAEWLPPVGESHAVAGRVTGAAAEATGLPPGTPVVHGSGDDAACAVGCGAVQPGIVASSVGTSAVLLATCDRVAVDPLLRLDLFCHAVPGRWQLVGATTAAGASLRWLRDAFGEAERAEAERTGRDAYDLLCGLAAAVPSGSDGLVFLPHLMGMRTPIPDARAAGAFFGITPRHAKPQFVRAVLEGVAFGLRDSVELFREMGVPLSQVRAIGGGARSALWRQIQADVLGVEHATVAVGECAAFGAALLAAVGIGSFADLPQACRSTIRTESVCAPSGVNRDVLERAYRRYRALTLACHELGGTELP